MRPTLRAAPFAFLVHHNPFYLLSALCMTAGCYAINIALDLRSGEVGRVLVLVGVINLYEVMLIALGVYLVRVRGVLRDGQTLLLLQAIFLVDLTFLNAEMTTGRLSVGVAVSSVLFPLALLKAAAVLWGLAAAPGAVPWETFVYVAVQLAALSAVPCLFCWFDRDGSIQVQHFYAIWWVVGLLPAMGVAVLHMSAPAAAASTPALRPRIGPVYVVAGYGSLLAHMGMMHWVYRVPFAPYDLSPVLLGLTFVLAAPDAVSFVRAGAVRLLKLALPIVAVALAMTAPAALGFPAGRRGRLEVTPVLLTLAGAYLAYVYVYFLRYAIFLVAVGMSAAGAALFGPTVDQVARTGAASWQWGVNVVLAWLPKTAAQWGVAAVAGAFAFLGIGAALSLSQGKVRPKPEPRSQPARDDM